jgi:ParB family chromosome partitioning protein
MSRRKRSNQPYQIKGVDALLGEQSSTEAVAQLLPLSQISLPQAQPRRYFDPQAMQSLVESIKQHGILSPLLVRPKGEDLYELVAGERRCRAAKEAGLDEVPVVIRELTDEDALQVALLENLQREDLNPLEETEGILQLLALKLNQSSESAIALLNAAAHPERNSVDNVIHSSKWQTVVEVFTRVGKFTPESFRTNRLPLLNLPDEIKEALRFGRLSYTKARSIARVKDRLERQEVLDEAIAEDLSLNQIKDRIKSLLSAKTHLDEGQPPSLKSRMDKAIAKINQSKILDDPKKKRQLEKLLAQLEALGESVEP